MSIEIEDTLAVTTKNDSDGGKITVKDIKKMNFEKLRTMFSLFYFIKIAFPIAWGKRKIAAGTNEIRTDEQIGYSKLRYLRKKWEEFINDLQLHNLNAIKTSLQHLVGDEATMKNSIKCFLDDVKQKFNGSCSELFNLENFLEGLEQTKNYGDVVNYFQPKLDEIVETIQSLRGPEGQRYKNPEERIRYRVVEKRRCEKQRDCWDAFFEAGKLTEKVELVENRWKEMKDTYINQNSPNGSSAQIEELRDMPFNWDMLKTLDGHLIFVVVDSELVNGTVKNKSSRYFKQMRIEFEQKFGQATYGIPANLKRKSSDLWMQHQAPNKRGLVPGLPHQLIDTFNRPVTTFEALFAGALAAQNHFPLNPYVPFNPASTNGISEPATNLEALISKTLAFPSQLINVIRPQPATNIEVLMTEHLGVPNQSQPIPFGPVNAIDLLSTSRTDGLFNNVVTLLSTNGLPQPNINLVPHLAQLLAAQNSFAATPTTITTATPPVNQADSKPSNDGDL